MKKVTLPCLSRLEWDFRGITETELSAALEYELLRSHQGFRKQALEWLDRGIRPNDLMRALLVEWPDFPKPWLACDKADRNVSVHGVSQIRPRALAVYPVKDAARWERVEAIRANPHGYKAAAKWWILRLDLDGDATTDELVGEFKRWLRVARKGHGPKRGKGGKRTRFDLLKALAALRMSKHLTYAEAQKLLLDQCKLGRFSKPEVWPFYEEKSGWSDAIKRAKSAIKEAGSWLA